MRPSGIVEENNETEHRKIVGGLIDSFLYKRRNLTGGLKQVVLVCPSIGRKTDNS